MGKAKQAVAARPVVDPAVFRRRRRNLAIVGGAIVLLVALLTAFIAPGWAWMDRDAAVESVQPPTPAPRIGEQTALV
ncbi:MAG: hypothetical protein FWG11_00655, partial [Promicromonosporaceae bacterium]|nr:hypothetical protein [Promicromonosporaceae bacterium]